MRSRNWILIESAALLLSFLLVPAGFLAAQAEITYSEGIVRVERGTQSIDGVIGTPLEIGDTVVTGSDGIAIIALTSQTTIKTRSDTRVKIDSLGEHAKVGLSSGGLFSRIIGHLSGSYEVATPTTTAGVRGTEFFMAYGRTIDQNPDVWLCVNSGTVAVSVPKTGDNVDVPAGKGIDILSGLKLTEPRPYKWTKQLNWNMDPNAAPVRDHTNLDQAYSDLLNQDYD